MDQLDMTDVRGSMLIFTVRDAFDSGIIRECFLGGWAVIVSSREMQETGKLGWWFEKKRVLMLR